MIKIILIGIMIILAMIIIYKIGKYKWSSGKNFIKVELIALVVLIILFILSSMITSNENIDKIKNAQLYGFEGITINEVINKSLKNTTWSIDEDENVTNVIVEGDSPNGILKYKITFNMTDKESFIGNVSINGTTQEALMSYSSIVALYDQAGYISNDNYETAFNYFSTNGSLLCITGESKVENNSTSSQEEQSSEQQSNPEEEQSQGVDEEQEGVNEHGDGNIETDYLDSVLKQCGYKNGNDELTYQDLILDTGGYDSYDYELLNNYHNLNLTTECGDGTSTIYRFVIPETGDAMLTQITTYNQGSKRDYAGEYEINKFMEQLANRYHDINK